MTKNKPLKLDDYEGSWIQIKVPSQLQINIRIEALRENKPLKQKMIELLQVGYDSIHKQNS